MGRSPINKHFAVTLTAKRMILQLAQEVQRPAIGGLPLPDETLLLQLVEGCLNGVDRFLNMLPL